MKITNIEQNIKWEIESYGEVLCGLPTVYTYNDINCKINGVDYKCKDLLKYQKPSMIVQEADTKKISLCFKEEEEVQSFIFNTQHKHAIDSEALKETDEYKKAKTKDEILNNFKGLKREILETYFEINKPKYKLFKEAVDADDVSYFYIKNNKYFSTIIDVELDLKFEIKDTIIAIKQFLAHDLYDYLNTIYLNGLKLFGESPSEVFELMKILNEIDSEVCNQDLQRMYEHYVNFGKIVSTLTKEEQLNLLQKEFDEDELEMFEDYFEDI